MRCYTWFGGKVSEGIALQADERLGQVVFLGEAGRGRRWEKIALGRRNPAEVVNGRVVEAHPVKIVLPARDGKPEKVFYVLERTRANGDAVLMRVYTYTSYIRNGRGCWQTIAGKPETLISGYGAFGDAGRIGNWEDGFVVMKPGDVLKVFPSRGTEYALWIDGGRPATATWRDYENLQAVARGEAAIAEAAENPEGLTLRAGRMPCSSFQGGEITSGFKLEKGAAGASVRLGEEGRGRRLAEVPFVGEPPMVPCPSRNAGYGWCFERQPELHDMMLCSCGLRYEVVRGERIQIAHPRDKGEVLGVLAEAAVADLGKGIFGLVQSERSEPDAHLVRVCTRHGYTRRGNGSWELWKGSPTVVTKGYGADGAAGGIGSWDDGLIILREGDVVRVRPSGDGPAYALFVRDGKVQAEPWVSWKMEDAVRDPAFYAAKGTAPWGHVPADWIGRVVTIMTMGERGMSGGRMIPSYSERETGELISIEPFVLNLGWDGRDRHDVTVGSALWVVLTDKQVRRLDGEGAETRKRIRAEAEELRRRAVEATRQSHFGIAEADLRRQVQELAEEQGLDTMPTEGWDSLTSWVERARAVLEKWGGAEVELKALEERQGSGEVLVDFGGHFRVMGATGNAQYWVIRPDGSERDPDEVHHRKRWTSEGDKKWRLVGPEELALTWSKAFTAADHEFVVVKLPAGGCSAEQLVTVERIEREISERFHGAVGMSGTASPGIGEGWGLRKEPNPEPDAAPETPTPKGEPADLSQVDLGKLFNGAARK